MAFINDIREVSETALGQLSGRFGDLPRPLLAAIGAGDFAVERLAELREALAASLEKRTTAGTGDAREFAAEFPGKMQDAAADVLESVQKFAAEMPVRTQHLVEQLPVRVADMREALSPEQLKGAVDGYTQLAGVIYGSLADRGDKKWSSVLATAGHDDTVVDTPAAPAGPTETVSLPPDAAASPTPKRKPVVRPTATTSPTRKAPSGAAARKPARVPTSKRAAAKPSPTAAPRRGSTPTPGTDTPPQS